MSAVRAPVEVTFRATGVEEVRRGLSLVREETGNLSGRLEHLSVAGSMAASSLAEGGQRGVTRFAHSLAELGFAVNPVVGALTIMAAVVGERLIESFRAAREEAKKTAEEFTSSLNQMVNAGDNAALLKKAADLYRGTPAAHFRDGIVGTQKAMADALDQLKAYNVQLDANGKFVNNGVVATSQQHRIIEGLKSDYQQAADKLRALNGQLQDVREAIMATNNLPTVLRGLPAMKTTADSPDHVAKDNPGSLGVTKIYERGQKYVDAVFATWKKVGEAEAEGHKQYADEQQKMWDDLPKLITPATGKTNPLIAVQDALVASMKAAQQRIYNVLQGGLAHTIGSAIKDGVTAGFSGGGIGGAFKAATKALLAGFGDMMVSLGEVYLEYGGIMQALSALLPNPFTAGAAGLAIGAALIAMGSALGAVAHGGSGGGGASSYAVGSGSLPEIVTRGIVSPYSQPDTRGMGGQNTVVNHNYIIGPADPVAQRMWDELQRRSRQRGSITGA